MARVALIQTTPDTVLVDVAQAMDAAGYEATALDRERGDRAEDQRLMAPLVSGLLDHAVAAGWRDPQAAGRRVRARVAVRGA